MPPRSLQVPHAQCPMPNAQCPMPNAPCPMPRQFAPSLPIKERSPPWAQLGLHYPKWNFWAHQCLFHHDE
ncbi:hypothetical protein H6G41_15915 [Tolypothrix sp. FACHB-123]|uniref:hypothetical protein n=1 Tax=Tolypothrix sp. FACHB-123 TaxID=2692868 RepID=UPI001685D760|nr:hypothetical protein [Tolypothrix sp. FACHB-123]MBD2356091.1 hypothetical protein [Tolypothrix sp. FACHB-123]